MSWGDQVGFSALSRRSLLTIIRRKVAASNRLPATYTAKVAASNQLQLLQYRGKQNPKVKGSVRVSL